MQERTGHALVEVQRALRRIVRSGLVTAQTVGNRVYYRAQPDHPAFTGLQDAFLKTVALADHVREALASLRPQIDLAAGCRVPDGHESKRAPLSHV